MPKNSSIADMLSPIESRTVTARDGWNYDSEINGFRTSNLDARFACNCGEEFHPNEMTRCACGQTWASFIIEPNGKQAGKSTKIVRSVPEFRDRILASRGSKGRTSSWVRQSVETPGLPSFVRSENEKDGGDVAPAVLDKQAAGGWTPPKLNNPAKSKPAGSYTPPPVQTPAPSAAPPAVAPSAVPTATPPSAQTTTPKPIQPLVQPPVSGLPGQFPGAQIQSPGQSIQQPIAQPVPQPVQRTYQVAANTWQSDASGNHVLKGRGQQAIIKTHTYGDGDQMHTMGIHDPQGNLISGSHNLGSGYSDLDDAKRDAEEQLNRSLPGRSSGSTVKTQRTYKMTFVESEYKLGYAFADTDSALPDRQLHASFIEGYADRLKEVLADRAPGWDTVAPAFEDPDDKKNNSMADLTNTDAKDLKSETHDMREDLAGKLDSDLQKGQNRSNDSMSDLSGWKTSALLAEIERRTKKS